MKAYITEFKYVGREGGGRERRERGREGGRRGREGGGREGRKEGRREGGNEEIQQTERQADKEYNIRYMHVVISANTVFSDPPTPILFQKSRLWCVSHHIFGEYHTI